MDPNATLAEIRQLVQDMEAIDESGDDPDEPGEYYRIASEAAHAFASLDGWITKGGFLPSEWAPPKMAVEERRGGFSEPSEYVIPDTMVRRIETVVDKALRDDERIDKALVRLPRHVTDEGDLGHFHSLIANRAARAVADEILAERRAIDHQMQAFAVNQALINAQRLGDEYRKRFGMEPPL